MSEGFSAEMKRHLEEGLEGADSWFAIYDALRALVQKERRSSTED